MKICKKQTFAAIE